ncbi:DNA-binding transcriptional ArsR family regulator [Aeromicrobium panaciterrae]|uniref:DNA-binding transcriptional ArsR family regulator n=1 Tax=Aeromicrobium panaciterrae TaxID=363861 RepID=A0ABU1UMG3_9ACTN|nr:metalloregulator ArsR/SmtB family transcription factor [Aeromicrobium panaciterrae]MDR7086364.1 DNA-binding transcriptional ArsR family regulator [Aeromicrobium panaciterrae]
MATDTEVFSALGDATRWQVLTSLAERGEGSATVLARDLPVSRPAVLKHLQVLDRVGLVGSRKVGREVLYSPRSERLDATARRMAELAAAWDTRLAALKKLAESQ